MAKDIAQILGASVRRDGFYEGEGVRVTWTYGHLCTLKEPADYTPLWKRWSLGQLPMIPERFSIKIIGQESIERQFHVIESLIADADEVINCGDAGQEGELIQRWVMQKANVRCPVKRLWISSLTDESIKEGFNNLRPQADFDPLYHAGLSRAIGDWILGMNATRLYTLKYSSSGNVLSIGRVQTPTLALVVQRHKEIASFVAEDYWEIKTVYRGVTFNSLGGRYKSEDEACGIVSEISQRPLVITDVTEKQGREAPPRLFDLTSLQVECNKKWGWTADDTLKLIQSLYEKKVTTYPRVDTTYLSTDLYPKIPGILKDMLPYANLTASVLAAPISKSKKIFDNAKVTDHHAIIPTGVSPASLVGDERKLYHLIALRFIAAFYPDCRFLATTVNAVAGDFKFKATGKVITEDGWRGVYSEAKDSVDEKDGSEEGSAILPVFVAGESGSHEPSLQKKTTQPPKYYTEGTLLRAMESAGRMVDDEELREAMKENGIGRPSTRSAIIETLFKRRYIYRQRKSIMASAAGIQLIDTINQELLKSAKLTGLWENKLRRIERKQYSAAEFICELKDQISEIVINVLSDNSSNRIVIEREEVAESKPETKTVTVRSAAIKSLEQITCPECGSGHLVRGRTAYGCSNYKAGCTLILPFEKYPADLTPAQLNRKIKKEIKKTGK